MEKIYCTTNQYSIICEGNVCSVDVNENICKIYNDLFSLGIIFSKSLNNSGGNLSAKNCPFLLYGPIKIDGGNFNSFFKRLTKIDSQLEVNDYCLKNVTLSQADFLFFEKMILVDLQAHINLYTYLKFFKKLNWFTRFMRFILQPINSIFTSSNDNKNLEFFSIYFDISDKNDVKKFNILIVFIYKILN
jgi:hypothetical protein